MQDAQFWMMEFWTGLSLLDLIGGSLIGTLVGLGLGIATWLAMHRRRWFARRNRWHHYTLATYVVLLPLLFAFTGLQMGFAAGAQRALYKQIDHFQPHLQTLVASWMVDFEQSLDDPALATLMRSDATVHDATRQVLGKALALSPDSAFLQYELGLWLKRHEQHEYALLALSRAVELDPDNADYRYTLAVTLHELDQPDAAQKQLETVLNRQPANRRVRVLLIQYWKESGQLQNVQVSLAELERQNPDDPALQQGL